jgi:hypothetical protein
MAGQREHQRGRVGDSWLGSSNELVNYRWLGRRSELVNHWSLRPRNKRADFSLERFRSWFRSQILLCPKHLQKTCLPLRETNEVIPVPSVTRKQSCFVAFQKRNGFLGLFSGQLSEGNLGAEPCAGRRYKPFFFELTFPLQPLSFSFKPLAF